ncbi:heterokaryon incompatibility HET-6 protein [Rutstroemia sp. NJR-2017a WRK4]|nr:heterokaryon incompatibility HET-6 protein [Rutstroemia sp. NJR-2017a WRK4]
MASWHQTSCATPDVFAEGDSDTLRCRSCGIVVQVRDLIAQQASRFSPIAIPLDEPVGQMDLWWPPSVPYSREPHAEQHAAKNSRSGSTAAAVAKRDLVGDSVYLGPENLELSSVLPHEDSPSSPSTSSPAGAAQFPPIYGAKLVIDEFRLLCLYAADDVSSPIHTTLEVFRHDDCPEYETVSYTWGGEDGDSTPCRPVFVGPYWNILLQTKNCWDMLRYMRPWRGIRMVWVDAICINQNDAVERAQQVAKMGAIYRSCSRVFVYLGSDIVSADRSKRHHPSRRGLHEFDQVMNGNNAATEGATTTTLQKMLTRRYFSRVWVIQELILSRNAVIPVGGVQFWASNLTPKYLASSSGPDSSLWDWNSTVAPWVQFIGGTSFDEDSLFQILRRTWQSKASDPRDKLFGILGLLRSQTDNSLLAMNAHSSGSSKMVPNYQLSTLHTFIGFFAHILINLGVADVLMNASGLAALPGYPLWVPDWQSGESFRGGDDVDETYTMGVQSWDARPSQQRINGNLRNYDRDWRQLSLERLPQEKWGKRRESNPKLYDMNSWRRTASIDLSTGALSIKLHHLFQFNANPVPTEVADLFEVVEEPCALYIRTQKGGPPLDTLVPPGRNHLFYLEKEEGDSGYLLLFLQELDCNYFSPRKSFKLLLCCAYADIFLLSPPPIRSKDTMFIDIRDINLQLSLHTVISKARETMGRNMALEGDLYESDLHDTIALYLNFHDGRGMREMFPWRGMREMFPWRGITVRDLLHVFQGYLNESRHQKPNFLEAYVRCLNEKLPQCQIKVTVDYNDDYNDNSWIELTLMPQDLAEHRDRYWSLREWYTYAIQWEWRYASAGTSQFGKEWKPCRGERWDHGKPDKAVSVRARKKSIIENIEDTYFYRSLRELSFAVAAAATAGISEDEVTMLTREPRWEDDFIPCRDWPQDLIDSFAADGTPWQVCIL